MPGRLPEKEEKKLESQALDYNGNARARLSSRSPGMPPSLYKVPLGIYLRLGSAFGSDTRILCHTSSKVSGI
jgi:hypothetical protein